MAAIGERNRLATIERAVDVANDSGGRQRSWTTLRRTWLSAGPVGRKEDLQAGVLQASQSWRVEMHYQDVTSDDRIVASWLPPGKVLAIQSVEDMDGRRETLVLFCLTEPLADG